jgi:phage tail sheath gpL-like
MASTAIDLSRVSRVIGYLLSKGDFREVSPNLPMRIALFGEANEDNQSGLDVNTPVQVTSAKQAGELFGYGSPLYNMMRILKPVSGDGIGGIPIYVYPQAKPAGGSQKIVRIIPTGVATGNGTHTVKINGRGSVDGQSYDISIVTGDTAGTISEKITNAIAAVLGAPVTATDLDYEVRLKTKWAGKSANQLTVSVETNNNALGITYAVQNHTSGAGIQSVANALSLFQNVWNTIVVNPYGLESSILSALEVFNGKADPENPTGRYAARIMKPFVAITGTTSDDPSATTDAHGEEMTNLVGVCPNSSGWDFEAAANWAYLIAIQAQNNPEGDIAGQYLPDMPAPSSLGSMANYDNRDAIVKKGCCTVELVSSRYQVQDAVLTYHPAGEVPPQYRFVRNLLGVDFNVYYSYLLKQEANVIDHVIAADDDPINVDKFIKPKQWKQIVQGLAEELATRGLITDVAFMKDSVDVGLNTSNPDRLDTFFRYKRTGIARIAATTAEAGFSFGS